MEREIDVGDPVRILPLEKCNGRVISVWKTYCGTKYQVRYFANSKAEEIYFYPDEIEPQEKQP
jgi:hypothetical protein